MKKFFSKCNAEVKHARENKLIKDKWLTNPCNGTTKDVIIPTPTYAEGQTSGEWVSLGTYTLQKGNSTTVTVTTGNANGYVAVDAILFVPEKK